MKRMRQILFKDSPQSLGIIIFTVVFGFGLKTAELNLN